MPYWMFVLTTMALADAGLLVCLDWLGENTPREVTEGMDWKYLLCPGFFGGLGVLVVRLLKGRPGSETVQIRRASLLRPRCFRAARRHWSWPRSWR